MDRYPEAVAELSSWLAEGRLTSVEDTVREDITAFPSTLLRLFNGQTTGKLVLELDR
jgi:NADPH-dependent curcumin reductase CurA